MNRLGQFKSDWIRYSDYELQEDTRGALYIVPTQTSEFTIYNPFEVADEIVFDLLELGDEALKYGENTEILYEKCILFAKKYGLLGLITSSVYNRHIAGEQQVLFVEGNLLDQTGTMAVDQYMRYFFPFSDEEEIYVRKTHKETIVFKAEDSPKFYGKRSLILDLVFSRFYAERVDWLIHFSKNIAAHFNQVLIYRKSRLTDDVTVLAGKFKAEKIGLTVTMKENATLSWEVDALKTAIEILYAFKVTDKESILNRCVYCHKIFEAKSNREKYCSFSCRNCANVIKSRQRKKEQLQNQVYNSIQND
ncbi:MAG: CGNR zinc finger domain-containing protein [Candidatus Cellulosilyticum pullistercoris]|uniref:CGNR zinc finger domain-containing protein n=1 Tax=Candidatus Cellulosilyticum pullistercoris TaxID=2838521 RepID=A0A9E2NL91_9FIRM|nr:CGNR zinc finger domain-containing protein [Candidatus Cellulosilyticum pullistercoris]